MPANTQRCRPCRRCRHDLSRYRTAAKARRRLEMIQQALGGLVAGGAFALIAVCIVLMYQMLGVLNFAQSAMGGLAACASLFALTKLGWGPWPATLLAV